MDERTHDAVICGIVCTCIVFVVGLISSCTSHTGFSDRTVTSGILIQNAKKECESQPYKEGLKYYCETAFIQEHCISGLDLRICGKLEQK